MCVNEIFTELRPDGRQRTWSEADLCSRSRHGQLCDRTQELRRPLGYRRTSQLPPTPPLSYHSDYASDSDRSGKRRSAIYINDHKVVNVNRRHSLRHERQGSGERTLYVNNSPLARSPLRSSLSPLSRTPPIHHHRSISSSPARDVYDSVESGSYREVKDRDRPTSIKVEIINERPKSHRRQTSSSKTNSSRDSNDEERRQRRVSDLHPGDQQRQRTKQTEIARQNDAIANRKPVPAPVPAPQASSVQSYRRGSVSIASVSQIQERKRLEEEKKLRHRELKEEEAQKQRLKDRFTFKNYHYAN
ncbi:hypothetical protein F5B18DRAFT_644781 [Nemania serpens]|nr:hypothetical protein F5B18DRAFT_644781 [Nemania serpens]